MVTTLAIVVTACAGAPVAEPSRAAPRLLAEPWAEADASFRSDGAWLGGDGALSIPLDAERTLWLFGDSFVVDDTLPSAERSGRAGAVMVRNSIAIQAGTSLASARVRFHVRRDAAGRPAAFFGDVASGETWLWPGHGLRTATGVIVFMHRMRRDDAAGGLGFRPLAPVALSITGLDEPPHRWRIEELALPPLPSAGLVGAAVLRDGPHVYAFGVRDPGDRALTLVRWPAERFLRGELASPEVWTGDNAGFAVGGEAAAIIAPVSTELSVTADPRGPAHGFVLVHSAGFGIAPIAVRFARALHGPWSEPALVDLSPYVEPGGDTLVYAAKAHPEQQGAEWVVTFAINSLDATRIWRDLSIYYPRVLRIRRSPRGAKRPREGVGPRWLCRRGGGTAYVPPVTSVRRARRSRAWCSRRAHAPAPPARSRTTCAATASPPAHR